MNKYIFRNANNGYYYTYTYFETESELSNDWHLKNIIDTHNIKPGPINPLNGLPYGAAYARTGENFEDFKKDCERSDIHIHESNYLGKHLPDDMKDLYIIKGISGNY
jgi:hypothetical protein